MGPPRGLLRHRAGDCQDRQPEAVTDGAGAGRTTRGAWADPTDGRRQASGI